MKKQTEIYRVKETRRDKLRYRLDAYACILYNAAIYIKNMFRNKKVIKRNIELKKARTKTCLVMGNGPSLSEETIGKIKNEETITVNFFHRSYPYFDSTYHIVIDPSFVECKEDRKYILELYQKKIHTKFIFVTRMRQFMISSGLNLDRAYFVICDYAQYKHFLKIDMTKTMTGGVNVIPFSIECALYMGYKKIGLLGCDFNSYTSSTYTHMYEKNNRQSSIVPKREIAYSLSRCADVHIHHYAIADYCKEHNIIINNLTLDSAIDAYPKVEL